MKQDMKQAVGSKYVLAQMLTARDRTWEVVDAVAARIKPGMRESEATALCKAVMTELGMDRIWHPVIVRFGENTLKTFKQRADDDPACASTTSSSSTSAWCGTRTKAMRAQPSSSATMRTCGPARTPPARCSTT